MGLIITLIILGIVLLLAEILLIPGIGFAGILGVVSMGGASYYAFYLYGMTSGLIVLGVIVVLLILFLVWALRAKTWERVALKTNITSKAVDSETKVAVGDKGMTATRLAPMGNVRFDGHLLEVTAMDGMIPSGVEVEVVLMDDNKILVKQCK